MAPGADDKAAGFTLVELVMTLVMVAILSVFAISRMDFVSVFQERGYHDRLKAALQFARKAAVASRRYVCISVAGSSVSFTMDPNAPESVGTPNCTAALALPAPDSNCGGPANQVCVSSGVALLTTGVPFQFDARGRSSGAATFTGTGQPVVTVENETGYVH